MTVLCMRPSPPAIVEQYEAAGIVKRVHGARPIDEVFADITKVLTDAMPELTTRE